MSEDGYIPEKKDFSQGTPTVVPLTPEDADKTVLIRTATSEGIVDVPTDVAYGLPNEMNREASGWHWASCHTSDGEEWSHFKGHNICVDISLTSWNERKVDAFKGYDEVRGHCSAVVSFNRLSVWEVSGSDVLWVLDKVRQDVDKLLNCMPLIDYISGNESALIGRKIYWRDQPAVITRFIGEQGAVMIKADPGPWILPAWRQEEYLTHSDYEDEVKADILDPNIWWWRDSVKGLFPEGMEVTLKTKQVVTLSRNGEPILDTQGDVYEWDTIEDAKQAAYEVFSTPPPIEDPVSIPVDATVPVAEPVSTPVPYARFEGTPIINDH